MSVHMTRHAASHSPCQVHAIQFIMCDDSLSSSCYGHMGDCSEVSWTTTAADPIVSATYRSAGSYLGSLQLTTASGATSPRLAGGSTEAEHTINLGTGAIGYKVGHGQIVDGIGFYYNSGGEPCG